MAEKPGERKCNVVSSVRYLTRQTRKVTKDEVGGGGNNESDSPPFIVVPRDDLVEGVVERDASARVDDARTWIVDEILRHDLVVRVTEDALEFVRFGRRLERREQFLRRASLLELDGEIDEGYVGGRATHGHAGEDAIELGDDDAHGLRGPGRGRYEVGDGGAAGGMQVQKKRYEKDAFPGKGAC